MSAEQTTTLVQRRARDAREAQSSRSMSLARAIRLTAAKQAEQLMGLALSTLSITRRRLGVDDIPECLDPAQLIVLMEGAGDQVAAAILDPVVVEGLIQQQTMGTVLAPKDGAAQRRLTSTDAALCAPFIEKLLSRAALLPDAPDDCALLQGYRFGIWAPEPRQAQLALDAPDYELIETTLDLAAGTRSGKFSLLLPHQKPAAHAVEDGEETVEKAISSANLAKNVMGLHADLMIALTRLKMPLQQASAFKVGDVIDLNLSSLSQALVIDANGRAIAGGTLGQIDGYRAVQVEQSKARQYDKPRRRASDRDELDLPDVTTSGSEDRRSAGGGLDLPSMEPAGAEMGGFDPPAFDAPSFDAPDFDAPSFDAPSFDAPTFDAGGADEAEAPDLPSLASMDVFGDIGDLPDLPDLDAAAEAADTHMADWNASQEQDAEDDDPKQKQAGW